MYSLALVNGDWNFNILGSGEVIEGTGAICQLYALNLKTPLGSNVMEADFGSDLYASTASPTGKIQSSIRQANLNETQRLQNLYRQNRNYLENNQIPLSSNLIQTDDNVYQVIINTVGEPVSFNFSMNEEG